jgi:hypothetical protein
MVKQLSRSAVTNFVIQGIAAAQLRLEACQIQNDALKNHQLAARVKSRVQQGVSRNFPARLCIIFLCRSSWSNL